MQRSNLLPGASCLACWIVLVLFPADLARSQSLRDLIGSVGATASPQTPPLPSVARIIVPERGGTSYGSGSLVFVEREYAIVVTNWHVVSDRVGEVSVQFPDGFQSAGKVLKVDRDWDLAAIGIWRPPVEPMRFARQAPTIGDPLAIGGYGSGQWRLAPGRCTQFVSPGSNFPPEMIEVSVEARQGDSGGPILNQQGEIAGVLFGAGRGSTSGSHCLRVQTFLESVYPILREAPDTGVAHVARADISDAGKLSGTTTGTANADWRQPIGDAALGEARRAGELVIEEPSGTVERFDSRAPRPLVAAKPTPRRSTDHELREWVSPTSAEGGGGEASTAGLEKSASSTAELDQKPFRVARIDRRQLDVGGIGGKAKTGALVAPREPEDCSRFDPAFPSLSGGPEGEVYSLSETESLELVPKEDSKETGPGDSWFEQGKAFLALLGGVTVLFQLAKVFGGKGSS